MSGENPNTPNPVDSQTAPPAQAPVAEAAATQPVDTQAVSQEQSAAVSTQSPAPSSMPTANAQATASAQGSVQLDLPDFGGNTAGSPNQGIELLNDVELDVKIELGRAVMLIEDVLKLGEGSVVELDKLAGDPVDVFVNDRLVARGEVLVLNDNFCVRVSEIVAGQEPVEA